ncbi:MAG: universal stress protein [Aggregatilineales bacterium]
MGYKRLLVTLDGSKFSERALNQVVRIAETGAYIHLLSVKAEDPSSEVGAMAKAAHPDHSAALWPPIPPVADPLRRP